MVRATNMKVNYKGLVKDVMASGATRWRVRPVGQAKKRIPIPYAPGHELFPKYYNAARQGIQLEPEKLASDVSAPKSIGWLVNIYVEFLENQVKAGTTSAKTLKKKRNLLNRIITNPNKEMLIPQEKLIAMQDAMSATPSQAHAFIEAVGVMSEWAMKRKYVASNPTIGIASIYRKGTGAKPWQAADVKKFFAVHKPGTKAHVAMSVLLWTGCRIEDLTMLGRDYERVMDGIEAICWTPMKKGSSEVQIPFLPPLKAAVRAPVVQGKTYVLGRGGKPFSSGDSMSAMFKRWCVDAGLPDLSAHGVRKGLAGLLAELGCTNYQIMAILGHSEAKTSEVYTKRASRWKLAMTAFDSVDLETAWA